LNSTEMSPTVGLRKEAGIGEDMDEPERAEADGSTVASESGGVEAGGRGGAAAGWLPAGEAVMEEISGARSGRAAARERGAPLEPGQAAEVSGEGTAAGAGEVRRERRGTVRADPAGREQSICNKTMDGKWITRDCGGGCWPKGCGARGGSGNSTGVDGSGRSTLERWCS